MRYRFDADRATVYFSETNAVEFDGSQDGLIIGLDAKKKIATVTFVNPVKRSATNDIGIAVRYDADGDALDIELDESAYYESAEAPLGHIIDFNAKGEIVAVEFLNATARFSADALRQFSAAA